MPAIADEGLGAVDDVGARRRGGPSSRWRCRSEPAPGSLIAIAPTSSPRSHPPEPALLLRLGAVSEDVARDDALDAAAEMHAGSGKLLADDDLVRQGAAAAAIFLRDAGQEHAGPPGRGPGLGIGAVLRPPARLVRRELGLDEAAHAAAEDAQLLVHPGRPVAHRAAPRRARALSQAGRAPPPAAAKARRAVPFRCRTVHLPPSALISRGESSGFVPGPAKATPEGCCRRARAADWPRPTSGGRPPA